MGRSLILCVLLLQAVAAAGAARPQGELHGSGMTIVHPSGRQAAGIRMLGMLPASLKAARSLTGADLVSPVRIELVEDRGALEERSLALGGPAPDRFIQGLAFGTRRHILLRLDAMGADAVRSRALLLHELVHIGVHEIRSAPGAAAVPRWLDEGMAQYVEGRPLTSLLFELPLRARVGALLPVAELDESFGDERRALAYVESESLVRFLAGSSGGREFVRGVLYELRSGTDLDDALHRVTGFSLREQEQRWKNSLKSDVGASLLAVAPLLFAMFLALAVVVIALRRARRRRHLEAAWEQEESSDRV